MRTTFPNAFIGFMSEARPEWIAAFMRVARSADSKSQVSVPQFCGLPYIVDEEKA